MGTELSLFVFETSKRIVAMAEAEKNLMNVADDLGVSMVAIRQLRPYERNARSHSQGQIRQIADSIETFGFVNPILIDDKGGIICGHGRVEAARMLGIEEVPTIQLAHLTEAQKRAYILADNRLAELAGWDQETLAIELKTLLELETDFDVTVTGFSMPEIDIAIESIGLGDPEEEADLIDALTDRPTISKEGDLWLLGPHRLLVGDARKEEDFQGLLGDERAAAVFTDPPYNVRVKGHVSGNGRTQHSEFAMASGEMTPAAFTEFLKTTLSLAARHSADRALHYVCMDWRHMGEMKAAGDAVYSELKNLVVWAKTNAGMGSLYRSQHELIFLFKVGKRPSINNVQLGTYGRNRTNLWTYPGVNAFSATRDDDLTDHPTIKPTAMVADALLDCSHRGDVVLDPFGGSGTLILAAEQTGRAARVMEIDPKYAEVAIRRWQRATGQQAVNSETRRTFDEHQALPPPEPAMGD